MKINQIIFISIILLFSSCAVIQDKDNQNSNALICKKAEINFVLTNNDSADGIHISNILIDTSQKNLESLGINFLFDISVSKIALQKIKNLGYDSGIIKLSCKPSNGVLLSSIQDLNNSKRIHINKDVFFSNEIERKINYHFAFKDMEMKKGDQDIELGIDVYPVIFKHDTSSPYFCFLNNISPKFLASYSLKLKVTAPPIYKTTIEIISFKVNTKKVNPQSYDFSAGGSGYPDLYWELLSGKTSIYRSPDEKNVTEFKKRYTTKHFYSASDDILTINFADLDNGPFNTEDDIVDTYKCKLSSLKSNKIDTLSFGKIEFAIIKAKIDY